MRLRTKLGVSLATVAIVGTAVGVAIDVSGTADIGVSSTADVTAGASGSTWGSVEEIPGLAALVNNGGGFNPAQVNAVGCSTLGNCVAVGYYDPPIASGIGLPFVATEVNGTWDNAQPVAGLPTLAAGSTASLTQVSCGAPDFCTAVGSYTDTALHHFVVTETGGTWGAPVTLDASGLGSVVSLTVNRLSCPETGECTIIGSYTPSGTAATPVPFTADESGGNWGALQPLAGLASLAPSSASPVTGGLGSLSCGAPGDCTAGGTYTYSNSQYGAVTQPFMVSESGHSWGEPQQIPGIASVSSSGQGDEAYQNEVTSVSCPDASDCAVVGTFFPQINSDGLFFTLDETGGTWGQAKALSLPSGDFVSVGSPPPFVSCRSAGNCVIAAEVGSEPGQSSSGFSAVVTAAESSSGAWGAATDIPGIPAGDDEGEVNNLTCVPAGDCTVLGIYYPGGSDPNEIFSATSPDGGAMEAAQQVASSGNIAPSTQLACPQSGHCTVTYNGLVATVGQPNTYIGPTAPQLVTEAPAASATATGLAFTPGNITFTGAATTLAVSGSVSSAAGTPSGLVTVRVDGKAVSGCTSVSFSGTVSCKGTTAVLAGGKHLVTLAYSGRGDFAASTSASLPLTVAKRGMTTALALAKTSVTYGHESAEKFTASVSHAGSVDPTGKVAVRIGGTTICTITLNRGTGSCTLANTRLRSGTYTFVALYSGDGNYNQSESAKRTLKVAA
jgi:hypothetical protein